VSDPDIGICDECGDTAGRRFPTMVTRHREGAPVRLVAWLCTACRQLEDQP